MSTQRVQYDTYNDQSKATILRTLQSGDTVHIVTQSHEFIADVKKQLEVDHKYTGKSIDHSIEIKLVNHTILDQEKSLDIIIDAIINTDGTFEMPDIYFYNADIDHGNLISIEIINENPLHQHSDGESNKCED